MRSKATFLGLTLIFRVQGTEKAKTETEHGADGVEEAGQEEGDHGAAENFGGPQGPALLHGGGQAG